MQKILESKNVVGGLLQTLHYKLKAEFLLFECLTIENQSLDIEERPVYPSPAPVFGLKEEKSNFYFKIILVCNFYDSCIV